MTFSGNSAVRKSTQSSGPVKMRRGRMPRRLARPELPQGGSDGKGFFDIDQTGIALRIAGGNDVR